MARPDHVHGRCPVPLGFGKLTDHEHKCRNVATGIKDATSKIPDPVLERALLARAAGDDPDFAPMKALCGGEFDDQCTGLFLYLYTNRSYHEKLREQGSKGRRAALYLESVGLSFRAFDQSGLTLGTRMVFLWKSGLVNHLILGGGLYSPGGLKSLHTVEGLVTENVVSMLYNGNVHTLAVLRLDAENLATLNERSLSQNGNENEFSSWWQRLQRKGTPSELESTMCRTDLMDRLKHDRTMLEGGITTGIHLPLSRHRKYEDKSPAAERIGRRWNDGTGISIDSNRFLKYYSSIKRRAFTAICGTVYQAVRAFHKLARRA